MAAPSAYQQQMITFAYICPVYMCKNTHTFRTQENSGRIQIFWEYPQRTRKNLEIIFLKREKEK